MRSGRLGIHANRSLLTALPPAERARIEPHLQFVPMPLGTVLYESGDLLRHVYFPTDSIVSLLYLLWHIRHGRY
jgi:hypothetical protein